MPGQPGGGAPITTLSVCPQCWSKLLTAFFAAAAAFAFAPAGARAEVVDRVVASVGHTAITASEVEQEYWLEFFMEGKPPSSAAIDSASLGQVRDRMIDRVLLLEEVQANGIHVPADDESVIGRLQEIRDRFTAPETFQEGLRALRMSEDALRRYLAREAEILRLVDLRLRPEAGVESTDIEAYYRSSFIPQLAKEDHGQPPALADVEDRIREILVQKKINSLLEAWLRRLRAGREVTIYGSAGAENKT